MKKRMVDKETVDAILALLIFCALFVGMVFWCVEIRYGG